MLEQGLLLRPIQKRAQLDEVLGDLHVEFGFEPGDIFETALHRSLVESARRGEESREFPAL